MAGNLFGLTDLRMNARELRSKYLEFFESKGHLRHPSSRLVPIDVTGKLDETLLFTGAGMVQFKPYFRGLAKPPSTRLTTSQKCVRAVDIEEVGNRSHLTFFEMLGNFSFGDYFKEGAIQYAWEFLFSADWLALDPQRVCVTVFEDDDEAFDIWAEMWKSNGFDPLKKIHRLGEDKNYWPAGAFSNGPPGPCGPCSEIFYQTVDDSHMTGDYRTDEAAGRWLEIWNLVFMQYEWKGCLRDPQNPHLGYEKTGMDRLPKPCVDTGMGLERTACVLGGFEQVYDTDVFKPIVDKICQIVREQSRLTKAGLPEGSAQVLFVDRTNFNFGEDEQADRSVRRISDHIRTASLCIADDITPSKQGRGYVLRRLIRRAMIAAWLKLGIKRSFLKELYDGVEAALADPYHELTELKPVIQKKLSDEEERFRKTMGDGYVRLSNTISNKQQGVNRGVINGAYAFELYDTFGFPLEVTQEIAAEKNLTVDIEGYETALKQAQQKSRAAQGPVEKFGGANEPIVLVASDRAVPQTVFVGYENTTANAEIVQISPRFDPNGLATGDLQVCLDQTPFYAESGGQVGDTGVIESPTLRLQVTNTWKEMGQIWHDCRLEMLEPPHRIQGMEPEQLRDWLNKGQLFQTVTAKVDADRRRAITRNHTATHLLHAALRQVLGKHVTQAGSLVAPDRLRFDFTHREAMTEEQIAQVERLVNEQIARAALVGIADNVPIQSAKERGAMMLFGEKYGERVRVVEVPGFSIELCGGCHVRSTAEIGLFKITSESSSASGVRRIEAVTGFGSYEWVAEQEAALLQAARLLKTHPHDLVKSVEKLLDQTKELKKERDALLRKSPAADAQETQVGPVTLYRQIVEIGGAEAGKIAVDRLAGKHPLGVALVAAKDQEKLIFFCKSGSEAVKLGAHAGNLAREVAKMTGGGGGGSAGFAQAGGKDPNKLREAMEKAPELLAAQLKEE